MKPAMYRDLKARESLADSLKAADKSPSHIDTKTPNIDRDKQLDKNKDKDTRTHSGEARSSSYTRAASKARPAHRRQAAQTAHQLTDQSVGKSYPNSKCTYDFARLQVR